MVVLGAAARLASQLGGLAFLAAVVAAVVAAVHRWYVRESVPRGLSLLAGLAGVAVYLNTTTALGQVIGGTGDPTDTAVALFNIVAFTVGAGGTVLGRRAGDWFAAEVVLERGGAVGDDVGRLVRTVGRVIAVELPGEIDDMVGYDPVPDATKDALAGETFVFPRGLTVGELRERLTERLRTDYGIGHVDVDLADDGTVEYLALGARAAGIGPTLPPGTAAVAVRADPALAASPGDIVQLWEPGGERRRLTAELRGVNGDVVTLAVDAADAEALDPAAEHRLVTLPAGDRPDREFASLLRTARETFASVAVAADSPLDGTSVGALDVAVLAVAPAGGDLVPIPTRDRLLAPGDTVSAIGPPEALRRLEAAGRPLSGPDPEDADSSDPPGREEPAEQEVSGGPGRTDGAGGHGE